MNRIILCSFSLAALTLGAFASPAHADAVIRVGGSLEVGTSGTYYRTRPRRVRRVRHPVRARRFVARGSLLGGDLVVGFAEPPPPMPSCPCEPPPPQPVYAPPAQQPPVLVAQPAAPRPRPRRLALGIFAGGVDVEAREAGEAFGVLGRFQLGRHLAIEGELSRDEIENDVRVDHRAGGALILGLMPDRRLNPYLLGGGGLLFTDVANGAYQSKDPYAEVGIGLELGLTPRFSIALDGRTGARRRTGKDAGEMVLRTIAPPADEEEAYTRGRLSALLYF